MPPPQEHRAHSVWGQEKLRAVLDFTCRRLPAAGCLWDLCSSWLRVRLAWARRFISFYLSRWGVMPHCCHHTPQRREGEGEETMAAGSCCYAAPACLSSPSSARGRCCMLPPAAGRQKKIGPLPLTACHNTPPLPSPTTHGPIHHLPLAAPPLTPHPGRAHPNTPTPSPPPTCLPGFCLLHFCLPLRASIKDKGKDMTLF